MSFLPVGWLLWAQIWWLKMKSTTFLETHLTPTTGNHQGQQRGNLSFPWACKRQSSVTNKGWNREPRQHKGRGDLFGTPWLLLNLLALSRKWSVSLAWKTERSRMWWSRAQSRQKEELTRGLAGQGLMASLNSQTRGSRLAILEQASQTDYSRSSSLPTNLHQRLAQSPRASKVHHSQGMQACFIDAS